MTFKPMLSAKAPPLDTLKGTWLASPKLDGIRCVVDEYGGAFTRNMKPVPNAAIREHLYDLNIHCLDGELIVGKPTGNDVMNRTASGVMKRDGEPDWTYYVFDCWDRPNDPFEDRLLRARKQVLALKHPRIQMVDHKILASDQVQSYAERMIAKGYEGAMLRSLQAPYKFGRSTVKEGGLLKVKFFNDREATIIDVVEQTRNENEQTRDELGRSKRSKRRDGLVRNGKLGALVCQLAKSKTTFEIGTGLTDAQRVEMWRERENLIGKLVTFTYQDLTPAGVPRFPSFKGIRLDGV